MTEREPPRSPALGLAVALTSSVALWALLGAITWFVTR